MTNFNATVEGPDKSGAFVIKFDPNTIDYGLYYPVVEVSKINVDGVVPEICSFEDIGYLNIVPSGISG